ncbi:sulfite exporter TauE/SafE family protein [Aliidiomarina halalkaliphila]|uniref:Sulfite exporter TauE/SafE family protein n=1 Tax=Aliidiomarina halalkaliphila TaxID=2593535 RepID=A0A552X3Z9_9GAMM|nr:sulfite exporter TauE/SafE family protein [Aliidiomarina halalkaliphila]TRW49760.1 sulfite exporter TauE/SafE family protein [Aliidiomarina halalkaliphila]
MTETLPFLLTALVMGFAGSGHCLAMCGGLAAAMGMHHSAPRLFLYNLGRIFSYAIAGAIVGAALLSAASLYPTLLVGLRVLAGVFMVLLGLYFIRWRQVLLWIERLGSLLWKQIQPLARKLPAEKTNLQVLLAGMIWGWLPCGLVYSALAWSALSASPMQGAAFMLVFGAGTLPAMFLTGVFSHKLQHFLQSRGFRWIAGLVMIGYGIATLVIAVQQLHMTT